MAYTRYSIYAVVRKNGSNVNSILPTRVKYKDSTIKQQIFSQDIYKNIDKHISVIFPW